MKKRIVPWLCFDESLTDSNNWFQDRLGSYPYELL